ncbi:hypothetical protein EKH79_03515 [Dyella dinghuensis]|uniref:Uncharacterized protein n=1 Tax=Dyella dinghuensis TaxID=1920169 RepID=A0A3S0PHH1_9GAMM|nr:hypothetical protein [Dyella dinghuensis]RUL65793.1 hypothetical protein EKH79_03515 [Dyella dinghuensis]
MLPALWRRDRAALFLRRLMSGTAFLGCLLLALPSMATSPDSKVYFAGVAYTSNAAAIGQAFPHVSTALASGGDAALNQRVRTFLQSQTLPETIAFDSLGSIKDAANSTALALGVDRETTSVEHIGSVYKLRIEVSAQALFFDFKEKQVLGGFPFIIDFIDVSPTLPSDEQIQAAYHNLLFGAPGQHDLASEFAKTLARASVPLASNKHLRVTSSTLGPKALDYLHQYAPQVDASTLPQEVAEAFGTYLGTNQHLSVLPYSSNQALGSSMAARFIEGEVYDLKIPEADYDIHLNVAGFKKIAQSQTSVDALFLYGAFVDISVLEPLSGNVYFSQRVKQGESKTVPITQTSVDDWPATHDTLLSLFDNFTRSLSDSNNPWLKSGLSDDKQARDQFSSLGELIQSCR